MWLHKNQLLMGVMVVVVVMPSVLVKVVQARSDPHPLRKHFHSYGCQSNKTVSRELHMGIRYLGTRPGFLLGLSETSKTMLRILSKSSAPCRLRTNKLYCVLIHPNTKNNQQTFVFHEIGFDEGKLDQDFKENCGLAGTTEDGNKNQTNQENNGYPEQKTENRLDMICNFRVDELISLQSGYGFLSCKDDARNSVGQWKEWLKAVAAAEAEADSFRTKTFIGVICGTGSMLLFFLLCVVCRLWSARSAVYHSQRRPSNTSGRTYSTQDHHSSRP